MRFPKIADVAAELRNVNRNDAYTEPGVDEPFIDVRLQVWPDGDWAVHWGDSQYDQDHRGYWAASSVPGNNRRFNSMDLAREMIDEVRDDYAS